MADNSKRLDPLLEQQKRETSKKVRVERSFVEKNAGRQSGAGGGGGYKYRDETLIHST